MGGMKMTKKGRTIINYYYFIYLHFYYWLNNQISKLLYAIVSSFFNALCLKRKKPKHVVKPWVKQNLDTLEEEEIGEEEVKDKKIGTTNRNHKKKGKVKIKNAIKKIKKKKLSEEDKLEKREVI